MHYQYHCHYHHHYAEVRYSTPTLTSPYLGNHNMAIIYLIVD